MPNDMPYDAIAVDKASQIGRRVPQFCHEVGLSRSTVYNEMSAGRIKAVKAGKRVIITTQPSEYLATLPPAVMKPVRAA
jgi:hypothetical protein